MGRTYLYGIIGGENQAVLDVTGLDGLSGVRVIARDSLGCVVSDYRGSEFGALPKEQTVRALLAHQQVVEHVMRNHPVLPVKFGTVLASSREVRRLLSQAYSQLASALADIQDKVEIEVAATWDTQRVLQDISEDDEVVRTREAISRPGEPSREERIHLGEVVKACMDRRRGRYRERMLDMLKPLAVDVAPNALISDELVMNVAFLIDRSRQREFDERVDQLDRLFHDEITFRVIGPLPPYSFSTVEVARLTREQVEEARRTLRLGEVIAEAEVRSAYRRLAAEEQRAASSEFRVSSPTQRPLLSPQSLARLRQASGVLLDYCRARDDAQRGHAPAGEVASTGSPKSVTHPPSPILPRKGGGGSLFMVSIKGSKSEEIDPSRFGGTTGEHLGLSDED